jgi:hypothetical protein
MTKAKQPLFIDGDIAQMLAGAGAEAVTKAWPELAGHLPELSEMEDGLQELEALERLTRKTHADIARLTQQIEADINGQAN